jgi:FkbM family methyltransferase
VTQASPRQLALGLRRELRNWYSAGIAGVVVEPNRYWKGLRDSRLAQRELTLRLRSGEQLHIRANEFFIFVEVFVGRLYAHPKIDLRACKAIVDVGANVGLASVWFARECPGGRVVAVEPAPAPLERLRRNIAVNGLAGQVTVVPAAIAVHGGAGYVETAGGSSAHGRFVESAHSVTAVGVDVAEAQAATLGEVLEHAGGGADLMKLDCEGGEYAVLHASNHDLLEHVKALVGEYHVFGDHTRDEFVQLLADRGYEEASVGPVEGDHGFFWAVRSSG